MNKRLLNLGLMGRVARLERLTSSVFEKGNFVRTTPKALRNGVFEKHMTGVVVSYPVKRYSQDFVSVKVAGNKKESIFHISFWER